MTHFYPAFGSGLTLHQLKEAKAAGLFLSGSLTAEALLGIRDAGLLAASEYAAHLRRMRLQTDLPLIADLQSGFGNPMNTFYTAQEFERSGADALLISDQKSPAHTQGAPAITADSDFLGKIHAALDARDNPNTQIWALMESLPTQGIGETCDKLTWLDRLPISAIAIAHWTLPQLKALANTPHQKPLIATWRFDTPLIDGIDGWLDTGYLEDHAAMNIRETLDTMPLIETSKEAF